ncbi:cupin domain-containing protein [Rhodoblastus acidophilus]|uniref:Cupin domain-containing protein n=1 Tax=Candidatus Rhodoblastus alkanivorans TaxID=2954117 RepID=A0ABS9Z4F2_9HYPH|nr:cupin domain-containing protein [Candidatus Rhodoblastus alkanivorans]MCI4677710.1 cupin domain-containing protein [Candidatus Rhodoblastus alkanivorans]MCI4682558.1 cupin domain-containing protein [Candidatus Rhodoblastus alkanivorans]MDI4639864.1 cupin domain-containing protein [Rhodoblastus acidophilus]
MRLNDDLTSRAAAHAGRLPWTPSPAPGVERCMLFRIGDEIARATSIVRFAPNSRFPAHEHGGGEEILVLEGVFQDETGDYPAGSYLRNPTGTAHAPGSDAGCVIFVKLWQFRADDHAVVALPPEAGTSRRLLFENASERVWQENWAPGAEIRLPNPDGLEIFVLSGSFTENGECFERWSWLRLPPAQALGGFVGPQGVRLWLKAGALLQPNVCALEA